MSEVLILNREIAYHLGRLLRPHVPRKDDFRTWICRMVFYDDELNLIIKADNGTFLDNNTNQCINEIDTYQESINTQYEKFFVPILTWGETKYDGGIMTYTISEKLRLGNKQAIMHRDASKIVECVQHFKLIDISVEDNHNCAVTKDDRLVIYDYGVRR